MSNVIEFLERMGADAELRHASKEDLAQALTDASVDEAVGAAIIARSTTDIYALLDQQRPMFHVQKEPGREDEDEEDEDDEEGEDEPKQRLLSGA